MTPTSKLPSPAVQRPFVIPAAAAPDARDNVATRTVIDLERYRMRCNAQPAATPLSVRLNSPQHANPVRKLFADRGFAVEHIPDVAFEWVNPSRMTIKSLPPSFYKMMEEDANSARSFTDITDRMLGIETGDEENKILRGQIRGNGRFEIVLAYTETTVVTHFGARAYRYQKYQTFPMNLRRGEIMDDDLVELRNGDIVIFRDGTMFVYQRPDSI